MVRHLHHGERADARERHRRQGDLTGPPDQGDQRKHDQRGDDGEDEPIDLLVGEDEGQDDREQDQSGHAGGAAAHAPYPDRWGPRGNPAEWDTALWKREQDDEEENGGDRRTDVAPPAVEVEERDGVGVQQSEQHGAEEGEGKAAQLAQDRRRERIDDQQGERDDGERDLGGEHDAGQGGQARSEGPGRHGCHVRSGPVQCGQLLVVHARAHGHPEAGPEQQEAQCGGHHQGESDGDQSVPGDDDAREVEARGAEEGGKAPADLGAGPEHADDADQGEHQSDGHHHLLHHRGVPDASHDDDRTSHAEGRGRDAQDEDQAQRGRPALVHPELPVEEGHQHADGALREVEDPRGHVGDHKACGGQGEDSSDGEAGDGGGEQCRSGERACHPGLGRDEDDHDQAGHGGGHLVRRGPFPGSPRGSHCPNERFLNPLSRRWRGRSSGPCPDGPGRTARRAPA